MPSGFFIDMAYDPKIAKTVCERLTKGESLQTICKDRGHPHINTIMDWLRENEEFAVQYTRAREAQADYLAEAILDIADDESLPADSRRIRVDVRKWYAGKVRPKKYGDKQIIAGDEDSPVQHNHAVRYIKPDGADS